MTLRVELSQGQDEFGDGSTREHAVQWSSMQAHRRGRGTSDIHISLFEPHEFEDVDE